MQSLDSLPLLSYDSDRDRAAIAPEMWAAFGLDSVRPHVSDLLAKSLQDKGFLNPIPFVFPFDGPLRKAVVTAGQTKPLPGHKPKAGALSGPPKADSGSRLLFG